MLLKFNMQITLINSVFIIQILNFVLLLFKINLNINFSIIIQY